MLEKINDRGVDVLKLEAERKRAWRLRKQRNLRRYIRQYARRSVSA